MKITDRLTNWQRTQWARAGYPGLNRGNLDEAKIKPFLELKRPVRSRLIDRP